MLSAKVLQRPARFFCQLDWIKTLGKSTTGSDTRIRRSQNVHWKLTAAIVHQFNWQRVFLLKGKLFLKVFTYSLLAWLYSIEVFSICIIKFKRILITTNFVEPPVFNVAVPLLRVPRKLILFIK